jgi:hypothetical protein
MSVRFVLVALVLTLATVLLMFVGACGEVELLIGGQCGATGYLCAPPPTKKDQGAPPVERQVGALSHSAASRRGGLA